MATRCFSPPESAPGRRSISASIPSIRAMRAGSRALGPGGEAAAVGEVLGHREVREQPPVLEHVAGAAAVRGDVRAGSGVGEDAAVERDARRVRVQEPRDGVDDGGLARPRAAEEDGDAGRRLERGVESEAGEGVAQRDLERHAPRVRRAARAASASDATSAPSARRTESATSRSAAPSPPGTWRRA